MEMVTEHVAAIRQDVEKVEPPGSLLTAGTDRG